MLNRQFSANSAIRPQSAGVIELEDGWARIFHNGILELQKILDQGSRRSFPNTEYVDLYSTVYAMCTQKVPKCWSHQLYERYDQSICAYLSETVFPALDRINSGDRLVSELVHRWQSHQVTKRWMGAFFSYLNRFYVKRFNRQTLEDVCVIRFRELIYEPLHRRVTSALLDLIERGRNGERVDHMLLHRAINIYVAMGMGSLHRYQEDFQTPFLSSTSQYYAREAAQWVQTESCASFMIKAEKRLKEEQRRLEDYLHVSSREKLFDVLHQQLLLHHQEAVLTKENTGFKTMLKNSSRDDLSRVYRLYNAVHTSLPMIARLYKELIIQVGDELVARLASQNDNGKFVEELLTMHDRFYELTQTCMQDSGVFHFALKEAFETIVNKQSMTVPTAEMLATHCDKLLSKGGSGLVENEMLLEVALEKVVKIFTYLFDKDLFSDFYRKMLAKRLLLIRSVSDEAERSMIGKLKLKCGAQFTSKFEGMITDVRLASENADAFNEWLRSEHLAQSSSIDLNVQVLTTGFWPTYKPEELNLPPQMLECMDQYQRFYDTRTAHRRLAWIHSLGIVTLSGYFGGGSSQPIDIICSTFQAVILMLFNAHPDISIEDIGKLTNLPRETVKHELRPLVMGQYKVLVKEPAEGFNIQHRVRVNSAFTSPKRAIRIPLIANKVSEEERANTQTVVAEDRVHAVEAAIVRLMKARQTIEHAQLVAEVSQQLMRYFRPDPKQIKKCIDDLITREYMERDAVQTTTYRYMA